MLGYILVFLFFKIFWKSRILMSKNDFFFFCWKLHFKCTQLGCHFVKIYEVHGFLRQMGHLFFSESSWKPKTQPNDRRAAVWLSFLVFNSAFGRYRHWLITNTSYSFIIIVMSFIIYKLTGKWSNLPQVGSLSSESIDDERYDDDDEWVWCDRY